MPKDVGSGLKRDVFTQFDAQRRGIRAFVCRLLVTSLFESL